MVKDCDTPTMQLMTKLPIRPRALSCCEKRGMPIQRQKKPEKIVPKIIIKLSIIIRTIQHDLSLPVPGKKTLNTKQNHERQTGKTGIAPFINEACSTNIISSFGFVS